METCDIILIMIAILSMIMSTVVICYEYYFFRQRRLSKERYVTFAHYNTFINEV